MDISFCCCHCRCPGVHIGRCLLTASPFCLWHFIVRILWAFWSSNLRSLACFVLKLVKSKLPRNSVFNWESFTVRTWEARFLERLEVELPICDWCYGIYDCCNFPVYYGVFSPSSDLYFFAAEREAGACFAVKAWRTEHKFDWITTGWVPCKLVILVDAVCQ